MDIGNKCGLYPLSSIVNKKEVLLSELSYTRGICELDRSVCIVIDLADFLGVSKSLDDSELIVLRVSIEKGDFALIIPVPKMTKNDIIFKNTDIEKNESIYELPLISADYVLINSEVYLKIDVDHLSNFISNEISSHLTQVWNGSLTNLSFNKNDNLAKVVEKSFVGKKTKGILISNTSYHNNNNIVLCKIGNYQFSFPEKYMSELMYFNQTVSSIPNTPDWVEGVIDYQNNSLPLIDLSRWLGINCESNSKLLVIVENTNSVQFGFICDSVHSIEKPENVPAQHFDSISIDGLPFRNIIYHENKFIFQLNIVTLGSALAANSTLDIMEEWDIWKSFLDHNTEEVLGGLNNKIKEHHNKELLNEFVEVNYDQINLLFSFNDSITFFDDQIGTKLQHYPYYCDGLVDLRGTPTLIIDMAKYLGIQQTEFNESLLIKIVENNINIALRVPIPKVVRYDVDGKSTIILDNTNNHSLQIPSSEYYIINEKVYLKFDQKTIFEFLENELQTHLKLNWNTSLPNWSIIKSDQLAKMKKIQTQIVNYNTNPIISKQIQSNNYLICEIDKFYYAIEEDDVIQVISTEMNVSKIPDAPLWIRGIMNYQNTDVILVNLSELLQTSSNERKKQVIVVLSTPSGTIAIDCNSVYNTTNSNMSSIIKDDNISAHLPYINILNENGRIIFNLNIDYLQNSIKERKDLVQIEEWSNLLSVNLNAFSKNLSRYEKEEIYRNNSLNVRIGSDNYAIPIDDIITIRTFVDNERMSQDGLNLVSFMDGWIPSIKINDNEDLERIHSISLVLKCSEYQFELLVDELKLMEMGEPTVDLTVWETILGESPIGLKLPYYIEDGLAFGLDLGNLMKNSYRSLLSDDIDIGEYIQDLSLDPPKLIEESTVLSKQISNIWDADTILFLIINDLSRKRKSALNTELIQSINLENENDLEVKPWFNDLSDAHFYVTTTDVDQKLKVMQIPANCYLLGVNRESIKSDDEVIYVSLEDEIIPILEIKK